MSYRDMETKAFNCLPLAKARRAFTMAEVLSGASFFFLLLREQFLRIEIIASQVTNAFSNASERNGGNA